MMVYKACERCSGDLFLEEEGRFRDLVCLQCGFRPANSPELIDALRANAAHRAGSREYRRHRPTVVRSR